MNPSESLADSIRIFLGNASLEKFRVTRTEIHGLDSSDLLDSVQLSLTLTCDPWGHIMVSIYVPKSVWIAELREQYNPLTREPCSCGFSNSSIPRDAKFSPSGDSLQGFYWNCPCGSTHFQQVLL